MRKGNNVRLGDKNGKLGNILETRRGKDGSRWAFVSFPDRTEWWPAHVLLPNT